MEEMNLNGALLIKQPHYIPSLWYSLCFSVATHLSRFLRNTHTLVQSRVCSRAGGLRGLILELARYSHKTDRPTNYPKNYNILMFALTAMFTRTVWVCECVFVCACLTIFLFFGVCVCARVLESVYYADSWRWSPACRIERTDVWCSSLFLYCSAYPSHTMKSKS